MFYNSKANFQMTNIGIRKQLGFLLTLVSALLLIGCAAKPNIRNDHFKVIPVVEIFPVDTCYFEGMEVNLRYRISTKAKQIEPYRSEDIANSLVIEGGPEEVVCAFASSTFPYQGKGNRFVGHLPISGMVGSAYSKSTLQPGTFRRFSPGLYKGYSKLDPEHTKFKLEVKEVPESSKDIWKLYERAKSIDEWAPGHGWLCMVGLGSIDIPSKSQLLDSLTVLAKSIAIFSSNSLYRKEGLETVLSIMASNHTDWRDYDSLTFVTAVDDLLRERNVRKTSLLFSIQKAFFYDLPIEVQTKAAERFLKTRD